MNTPKSNPLFVLAMKAWGNLNIKMKKVPFLRHMSCILFPAVFTLSATTHNSYSAIIVTIDEIGNPSTGASVVVSYPAGTLDTSGLTDRGIVETDNTFFITVPGFISTSFSDRGNSFGDASVTRSSNWTDGLVGVNFSSTVGSGGLGGGFGNIEMSPNVIIYDDLAGSATIGVNQIEAFSGTIANSSLADLGLTDNAYLSFVLGNGDTLTFSTGALPANVPEPSSALLALMGIAGVLRRCRSLPCAKHV